MKAMTKAASAKQSKKPRKAKPSAAIPRAARKPRPLTFAEKLKRANIRWHGDDLEEIIALVEATRGRF
jgi:hypothetical protein